ncbi:MAG: S41 family peptidase [Prevotellaceae bacterium]|jgi:carboxyl-terminal processing protease|nr:S41 family peptidase [Prevotellaceae bacterium]
MKKVFISLSIALAVMIGFIIGNIITERAFSNMFDRSQVSSGGKIDAILNIINKQYVDSVDTPELIEEAIPKILSGLDPHSVYIPASDLQSVNEELEGSFSGIGVQFNIQHDTVMIVGVISGGPSEKLGILPGDRIVTVNDTLFVGKDITNEKVMKKLRGKKGTTVSIGIQRNDEKELLPFTIERGDIPVSSIDVAYKITDEIGYVKVSKFGGNTYEEFFSALNNLQNRGASKFIIDLRSNSGGYLESAIQMINEFLEKGSLIVYTEGKSEPRRDAIATGSGLFLENPLVILIDEWSASASEIFAGAIQDNDRGMIIGRRSFGKGLVQQQIPLRDGSAVRLTISRYYTPSGRSIQKPYEDESDYENDIMNRYLHGEFDSEDSIHVNKADSIEYHTLKEGRVVYGGGGIMPDIFVPRDTFGMTSYFNKVNNSGLLYEYAFQYADQNRAKLKSFPDYQALENYLNTQNLSELFAGFAAGKGIRRNPYLISKSNSLIENRLKAYIVRNISGDEGFYPIINQRDNTLKRAVEELSR